MLITYVSMRKRVENRFKSVVNLLVNAIGGGFARDKFHADLSLISGKHLPVYINEDGEPCFQLKRAAIANRVFILTIPKSGTYLIAKLLDNLVAVNCKVHIALNNVQDNRFAPEESLRLEPWKYLAHIPFSLSTRMIKSGQFAFGHIPHDGSTRKLLNDFKKVLSYRNMRDVITSLVRYHDSRTHKYAKEKKLKLYKKFKDTPMGTEKFKTWFDMWGEEYANLIKGMSHWKDYKDVFQLKFEILMCDNGKAEQISLLRDISVFMGLDIDEVRIEHALRDSIGSDTITYSGKRSSHTEWWNDTI